MSLIAKSIGSEGTKQFKLRAEWSKQSHVYTNNHIFAIKEMKPCLSTKTKVTGSQGIYSSGLDRNGQSLVTLYITKFKYTMNSTTEQAHKSQTMQAMKIGKKQRFLQ